MDAIDLRIAQELAEDGRVPNSRIARRLGIAESTVRQRLRHLLDSGQVRIQALVNGREIHNRYLAVIGLKLEGRQLTVCAERINRLPEVQRTLIVTGRYDLLVSVLLDSHHGLVDFVTEKLSRIPGIRDSETFVCLKDSDPYFPAACVKGNPDAQRRKKKPRTRKKRKRKKS